MRLRPGVKALGVKPAGVGLLLALASFAMLGCSHKEERFESTVQIIRKEVVEKDEQGGATAMDFEAEWDACPGDQFQVVRGGKDFATCAAKYNAGDYVPVIVKHFWDPRGYYRWDIERLGDCERPIDTDAYGSYEKSAECKEVVDYGRPIGFECSRRPFRALLKRCPWMARN